MLKESLDKEVIRFLFDKRLVLFNIRRDHEWKIFFGVMGLIAAVGAALVTKSIRLPDLAITVWRGMLIVFFIASVAYEFGVQTRNRIDRIVMDELCKLLCDATNLPYESLIRIPIDSATEKHLGRKKDSILNYTYLWAFTWQTLVLLVICAISWFIPILISIPTDISK